MKFFLTKVTQNLEIPNAAGWPAVTLILHVNIASNRMEERNPQLWKKKKNRKGDSNKIQRTKLSLLLEQE